METFAGLWWLWVLGMVLGYGIAITLQLLNIKGIWDEDEVSFSRFGGVFVAAGVGTLCLIASLIAALYWLLQTIK